MTISDAKRIKYKKTLILYNECNRDIEIIRDLTKGDNIIHIDIRGLSYTMDMYIGVIWGRKLASEEILGT